MRSEPPQHPGMDRDPGYGQRHTPFYSQPDIRIYELNKRLQQRTEENLREDSDNLWWDAFATEFFEDDATLTLSFCLEDGPKRYIAPSSPPFLQGWHFEDEGGIKQYTIGRTLIPRYFRTIFEGGVTDLYFTLKHPKESFHNTFITLDCENTTMTTHHGKPTFTKVCTDGRLMLEFTYDDLMRIKNWHFAIRQHTEMIPRSVIAMHDPAMLEQLSKNITRQGLTSFTLNYLRLCVILEPMQELMSRHKAYGLNPRDCLKTTLFQKWQRMVAPPANTERPPSKRRKRKASQSGQGGGNSSNNQSGGGGSKKKFPTAGDVMVVGEPSLMGGEFGDEDERLITRLENTQFDAANGIDGDDEFGGSPAVNNSSWGNPPTSNQGKDPSQSHQEDPAHQPAHQD